MTRLSQIFNTVSKAMSLEDSQEQICKVETENCNNPSSISGLVGPDTIMEIDNLATAYNTIISSFSVVAHKDELIRARIERKYEDVVRFSERLSFWERNFQIERVSFGLQNLSIPMISQWVIDLFEHYGISHIPEHTLQLYVKSFVDGDWDAVEEYASIILNTPPMSDYIFVNFHNYYVSMLK